MCALSNTPVVNISDAAHLLRGIFIFGCYIAG